MHVTRHPLWYNISMRGTTDTHNSREIDVYWSPATFNPETESWSTLYPEPKNIFSDIIKNNTMSGSMTQCPAIKSFLKNTFSFESAINDYSLFDLDELMEKANTESEKEKLNTSGKLLVCKERKSSYEGFINITFGMRWIFFASESLEMRWTAPYFPSSDIVSNQLFSTGQMDIGQWFRPVNLDMHIPINSKEYKIDQGRPLAFAEFMTDKKINLKRFVMTPKLLNIAAELSQSSSRYGRFVKLKDRYRMAQESDIVKIVRHEIINNLID